MDGNSFVPTKCVLLAFGFRTSIKDLGIATNELLNEISPLLFGVPITFTKVNGPHFLGGKNK